MQWRLELMYMYILGEKWNKYIYYGFCESFVWNHQYYEGEI